MVRLPGLLQHSQQTCLIGSGRVFRECPFAEGACPIGFDLGAASGSHYRRNMSTNAYKYLVRKPKSVYRQLFINHRWIAARTIYGKYVREESPMTPQEIARDFDLPLEAVKEAIAYCESNPPELAEDYAREEALMEATGMNDPNYDGRPRVLTPQEMARLHKR